MDIPSKHQQAILIQFIQSAGALSSSEVQTIYKISRKSLQSEIAEINRFLVLHGAVIESVMGKGYAIRVLDEEQYSTFKSDYLLNSQRNRYLYIEKNYLAYQILFRLILSEEYISVDQLSEEFHYSRSVISQNLKTVKEILAKYGCALGVKPNHGMIVEATEWRRRICILFLDKIALRMASLVPQAGSWFAQVLDKKTYQMERITATVIQVLRAHGVRSSQNDLVKVCLYTILAQTRVQHQQEIVFTDEQRERVEQTGFLPIADRVVDALTQCGYHIPNNDRMGVAVLLLAYSQPNLRDPAVQRDIAACRKVTDGYVRYLDGLYYGLASHFDETFCTEFTTFVYGLWQRLFFGIPSDEESGFAIKPDGAFTADLCRDFGNYWLTEFSVPLQEGDLLNAYYIVSSTLLRNHHRLAKFSVALVSRYGTFFANNVAQRVLQTFRSDICRVDVFEYMEVETVDLGNYDLLVTDIEQKKYNFVPIPVIRLDFYRDPRQSQQLREFFSIVLRERVEGFVQDSCLIHGLMLHSKQDAMAYFAQHYLPPSMQQQFVQDCLYNDALFTFERSNRIAFVSVGAEFYSKQEFVILFNKTAFVWTNEPIEVVIFFSRERQQYADIKYLNKVLGCFMHMPLNLVQELNGMDANAMIDYAVNRGTDKTEIRINK